jgi:hypothetical protein
VLAGLFGDQGVSRCALLGDEDCGAGLMRMEQVGFPMSWLAAGVHMLGAFADGEAVLELLDGAACFAPSAASGSALRQVMPPAIVFCLPDPAIDEAIDGLMADPCGSFLLR